MVLGVPDALVAQFLCALRQHHAGLKRLSNCLAFADRRQIEQGDGGGAHVLIIPLLRAFDEHRVAIASNREQTDECGSQRGDAPNEQTPACACSL